MHQSVLHAQLWQHRYRGNEVNQKQHLFGIDIDSVDMRAAVSTVLSWCGEPRPSACRYVVTPNVDHAVMIQSDPRLLDSYRDASLVLADGLPIVLASRLLRKRLPERVAGSDLVPALLAQAGSLSTGNRLKVFLLGAAPGVGDRAAGRIREKYPDVEVVGVLSPPLGFEKDDDENRRIYEAVAAAQPDVLVLGLGAPKQELWVHEHAPHLQAKVALCVGATIDFLAGHRQRAPRWMQSTGLEWLHRVLTEPRRLAKRYAPRRLDLPPNSYGEIGGAADQPARWYTQRMRNRAALVIVVDGLRATALGAYGNTSYPTPNADRLAARSTIVDWMVSDAPGVEPFYRSVWGGRHAARPQCLPTATLPHALASAGVVTELLTDDETVAKLAETGGIVDPLVLDSAREAPALEISDTATGTLASVAVEHMARLHGDTASADRLTWIHFRGFFGPWDAPAGLRESFLEEDDPPAPDFLSPPDRLSRADDPDTLLGARVAYAAQATVLDACLGALLDTINESPPARDTLVALVSPRGFPLGEHTVGQLYGETLHLPCILHRTAVANIGSRLPGLWQPPDVGVTLASFFGAMDQWRAVDGRNLLAAEPVDRSAANEHVLSLSGDAFALRNKHWHFVGREATGSHTESLAHHASMELYSKPDDLWEYNNVADRCPAEVDELQELASRLRQSMQAPPS